MQRTGVELRRRQLVDAAIATIGDAGFAGANLLEIARRAGVSSGLIAHYFGDKHGLLEATLRHMTSDLGRQLLDRYRTAATPEDRLLAIIDVNLDARQMTQPAARLWLAFWHEALHAPRFARILRANRRRLYDNLAHALGLRLPRDRAAVVARAVAGLIDGVWLRTLHDDGPAGSPAARTMVLDATRAMIAAAGDTVDGNGHDGPIDAGHPPPAFMRLTS